jgi:hypothetical protein
MWDFLYFEHLKKFSSYFKRTLRNVRFSFRDRKLLLILQTLSAAEVVLLLVVVVVVVVVVKLERDTRVMSLYCCDLDLLE